MQKKIVTSVSENLVIDDGVVLSGQDEGIAWSVTKKTLRGGVQEGVELLIIDNGAMQVTVVLTRGMSLLDGIVLPGGKATAKPIRVGWDSPVKQVVHPRYVNLNDQGGLGWLSGFNELLVRCGVSSAGQPGEDCGELLTLHGRIGNLPASEVVVQFDPTPRPRIRIFGQVEERRFKFGLFVLSTEVAIDLGSRTLEVCDRLTNASKYEREYQLIYHTNLGSPFLDQGASFSAPVKSVHPLDEAAAEELSSYRTYRGPTHGYGERVYCLQLDATDDGHTTALLHNASGELGVALHYQVDTLPYFNLWKNTDTTTDGYVTGLEPATGFPYNRGVEREAGRVPKLGPGESAEFRMSLQTLVDADEVQQVQRQIAAMTPQR